MNIGILRIWGFGWRYEDRYGDRDMGIRIGVWGSGQGYGDQDWDIGIRIWGSGYGD